RLVYPHLIWWACVALSALLFFFSSRRRHTRFSRDWSSDVCSSDLNVDDFNGLGERKGLIVKIVDIFDFNGSWLPGLHRFVGNNRSEERRVGKECSTRGSPYR